MPFSSLIMVLPELFLLTMICITLLCGVFASPRFSSVSYYLAQFSLLITAGLTGYLSFTPAMGGLAFSGTFVLDKLAIVLKLFIYLATGITFLYSHQYNEERYIPTNEFYVLGLLSVLGMMVLVSAHHLLTLYLGLELFSFPIYAMVALQRNKARCVEASMKYFVMGAVASGLLLYGMSMLFGATQSLDLAEITKSLAIASANQDLMFIFGLAFLMAGLAFKLGAAPLHMWVPDVYDGAPTSVTLLIASAAKIAVFGLVMRLVIETMPSLQIQWQSIWTVIAVLSMAVGNIAALVQTNIKRLLAYSSIAHMGYMILGWVCATPRGDAAALFYMLSYAMMTLCAFGMIILMSRAGIDANDIRDYAGLNNRNPWLAFMLLLVMFSMAGIPPIVGFIAKVGILEALIQVHQVGLAVLAILFAIIGAYYYIRVVKVMYFDSPEHPEPISYSKTMCTAISFNGSAVLLLGVFPGLLFSLSRWAF